MLTLGHASGTHVGDIDVAVDWISRSALLVGAVALALMLFWLSWGREESKL